MEYEKKFAKYELLESAGEEEKGVRIHFSDNTTATGTIAVGVDGANSSVRTQLLGPKLAASDVLPFALMNFNCSYPSDQAKYVKDNLHPLVDIAIHPAGHYIRTNILDMPDQKDASTWTFQILSTWPIKNVADYDNDDGSEGRLRRLKEHVKRDGWAEPYKSGIEWIPEGTEILRDQLKIWRTVRWSNEGGSVTLAGDAAHAMTFREYFHTDSWSFSMSSQIRYLTKQLIIIYRSRPRSQQLHIRQLLLRRGDEIRTGWYSDTPRGRR